MSLKQRAAVSNFREGKASITKTRLGEHFKKVGIKYKTVRLRKRPRPGGRADREYRHDLAELAIYANNWLRLGWDLVNVDEACFTWRGFAKNCWAPKHMNLELFDVQRKDRDSRNYVACCGAISAKQGKILFKFKAEGAFKGPDILAFVNDLHKEMERRGQANKYFILWDRASIHRTKDVRERLHELGVGVQLNIAYCPQYAGIETLWSASKRHYRNIGTKALIDGGRRDLEVEANQAINSVTNQTAKNCALMGERLIQGIEYDPNDLE